MPPGFYRVYIQFGQNNCVRFFAPGEGAIAKDGLQLFEWVRDPNNITRLRNGLRHTYEVNENELGGLLESKLREDRDFFVDQMDKCSGEEDMLAALKQKHVQFSCLQSAVDKLESISSATGMTVIPRASPRNRSDQPGWLYLLDLVQDTLEVYEFKDYTKNRYSPFSRPTIKSLYRAYPDKPPGYYIKLRISELESMWRSEWMTLHKVHTEALERLWRRNTIVLKSIPHADSLPFAMLYGSAHYGQDGDRRGPYEAKRLTRARLKEAMAMLNRRQPSRASLTNKGLDQPQHAGDDHLFESQKRILSQQAASRPASQRRRAQSIME
ncbi:hypothetical protein F5Y14DRAFT_82160 [Nemania sp. NC0429]|nr:hypothetical protein F5Y14DRAFT_82160 [Nemania sp. NC0429]